MKEKPSLIVRRELPEPHYELHYRSRVDFVGLDGKLLGSSKVEVYKPK